MYTTGQLLTAYSASMSLGLHEVRDASSIGDEIGLIELLLFTQTLGLDFYQDLINDKADLSAAVEFDPQATYAQGSLVIFRGVVFEAKAESAPPNTPENADLWDYANLFTEPEYNHIWRMYLRQALSFKLGIELVIKRTVRMTDQGLQVADTDYTRAADSTQLKNYTDRLDQKAGALLAMLDNYIQQDDKKLLPAFANYLPIKSGKKNREKKRQSKRGHGFHWG